MITTLIASNKERTLFWVYDPSACPACGENHGKAAEHLSRVTVFDDGSSISERVDP